jgi:choline dehydrogenase-like flavoprotein
MTGHAVVIAGGGPTGMMLAGELALAGTDVAIVERRASPELAGSRAGGLHSRTIEGSRPARHARRDSRPACPGPAAGAHGLHARTRGTRRRREGCPGTHLIMLITARSTRCLRVTLLAGQTKRPMQERTALSARCRWLRCSLSSRRPRACPFRPDCPGGTAVRLMIAEF